MGIRTHIERFFAKPIKLEEDKLTDHQRGRWISVSFIIAFSAQKNLTKKNLTHAAQEIEAMLTHWRRYESFTNGIRTVHGHANTHIQYTQGTKEGDERKLMRAFTIDMSDNQIEAQVPDYSPVHFYLDHPTLGQALVALCNSFNVPLDASQQSITLEMADGEPAVDQQDHLLHVKYFVRDRFKLYKEDPAFEKKCFGESFPSFVKRAKKGARNVTNPNVHAWIESVTQMEKQ